MRVVNQPSEAVLHRSKRGESVLINDDECKLVHSANIESNFKRVKSTINFLRRDTIPDEFKMI